MNKTTAAILALSALAAGATTNTRQAWSGALQQKSLDQYMRPEQIRVTVTSGIVGNKDVFTLVKWNQPDPNGMEPLADEVAAYGTEYLWWEHGQAERTGKRWQLTFAGQYTEEIIPDHELGMDPVGISWFSGLMVTEDGRHKTLGGFGFEIENRSSMPMAAVVTADWEANTMLMGHSTTQGAAVPAGDVRVIAVVPQRDEYAVATGEPMVEVK